jgi:hypothetical protein
LWKKSLKRGSSWFLENMIISNVETKETLECIRSLMEGKLTSLAHIEDLDFRLKAYKTDTWSFRWTAASLRMYQPGAFPRLPYYDNRIAEFFSTVPSQYVANRRLQIEYLKLFCPKLARITWQEYDENLYFYRIANSILLPKRIAKAVWRHSFGRSGYSRNWEVQLLNDRGAGGLHYWLQRPGLRIFEWFPPESIREVLERLHAAPDPSTGYTASMLLTFSVWLEKYF